MPERFECAEHRGDICALCMGLASLVMCDPPPRLDVARYGLPSILYIDVLDCDGLVATVAMFAQGFHLACLSPRQFNEVVGMCLGLRQIVCGCHPSPSANQCDVGYPKKLNTAPEHCEK